MRQIIQLHTDDEKIVSAYPLTLAEAVIVDSATTLDQEIESLVSTVATQTQDIYQHSQDIVDLTDNKYDKWGGGDFWKCRHCW